MSDLDREKDRINTSLQKFADAMARKLDDAAARGMFGWDCYDNKALLEEKLFEHAARAMHDPRQWIDVANFSMFLWNLEALKNDNT